MKVAGCAVAGCVLQSCVFRVAVAPFGTQPATRNFFRFSLGVPACVCVPYIYKIKIKKNNIPIGLRLVEIENTPEKRKRNRVAGCALG